MKKYACLLLTFLCVSIISAQDFDFGDVSKAELEEKQHPLEPEANAAVLYDNTYCTIRYIEGEGFQLETTVHRRIKIYNKDGFEMANHNVPLYKGNGERERISGLKAYTYNLENGKIKDTKLRKDGIFRDERNDNLNVEKITMPNIKEGSVVEYKYKMVSPYLGNVNEMNFQYDIPVNKIKVMFEAPEYFTYKKHYKGYIRLNPSESTRPGKITTTSKSKSWDGRHTSYSQNATDFTFNITTYEMENIPALKDESFVSNVDNYRSAVKFELAQVQMPRSTPKYMAKSWDDVVKTIYRSNAFGGELNKKSYFNDEIDAIIAGESNDFRKAGLIYNHVRNNIKWNGNYGKYAESGVRKAYKEKTGNVADINLMLTAMLRYAGVNANPVILSSRQHGIKMFPTLNGFNYVITAIEVEDAVILLDATNYYGEPNVLPMRALNWIGRLIREDGSWNQINLMPTQAAQRSTSLSVAIDEEGTLSGKQRTQYTSHNALFFREGYMQADKDDYLTKLENSIGDIEIDEHNVVNGGKIGKPVLESYAFVKESQAEMIGDKLYFSPLFYLATTENTFKSESRVYPVDFGYPWQRKIMMNINIPEGYEVESLPEPASVKLPDNMGSYTFNISKTPNGISVIASREINSAIITPDKYGALRQFYKMLVEKEKEKVVLKKI